MQGIINIKCNVSNVYMLVNKKTIIVNYYRSTD